MVTGKGTLFASLSTTVHNSAAALEGESHEERDRRNKDEDIPARPHPEQASFPQDLAFEFQDPLSPRLFYFIQLTYKQRRSAIPFLS